MKNLFNPTIMKKIAPILLFSLCIACNSGTKKGTDPASDSKTRSVAEEENKPMASGDYGTLLTNFNCNLDISEVAGALQVPQADLSGSDSPEPDQCHFFLKGFGDNGAGDNTAIFWRPYTSSKAQTKKEIKEYLKNQEEYPASIIQNMSIALSETKDCYIAQQPTHGRVIIYNENYDNAILLNYGRRAAYGRTPEQQDELKSKMTDLANYLLKTHRK